MFEFFFSIYAVACVSTLQKRVPIIVTETEKH
jgi:hypothetical protein